MDKKGGKHNKGLVAEFHLAPNTISVIYKLYEVSNDSRNTPQSEDFERLLHRTTKPSLEQTKEFQTGSGLYSQRYGRL